MRRAKSKKAVQATPPNVASEATAPDPDRAQVEQLLLAALSLIKTGNVLPTLETRGLGEAEQLDQSRLAPPPDAPAPMVAPTPAEEDLPEGAGKDLAEVFLSHNVSSVGAQCRAANDAITSAIGCRTFICTSMVGGDDFRRMITVNATKCKVFVPFVNEQWAKSQECLSEFNCALRAYNVTKSPKIVPVVVGGFGWIDVEKYPDVYNITCNFNCIVLNNDDWTQVNNEIISALRGLGFRGSTPAGPKQSQIIIKGGKVTYSKESDWTEAHDALLLQLSDMEGAGVAEETKFKASFAEQLLPLHGLSIGDKGSVQWGGTWYPSTVVDVNAMEARVRDNLSVIHYPGWNDNMDEMVPRSKVYKDETTGKNMFKWRGGKPYEVSVLELTSEQLLHAFKVKFDGYDDSWNQWVFKEENWKSQ